jgi:hypothetical protein
MATIAFVLRGTPTRSALTTSMNALPVRAKMEQRVWMKWMATIAFVLRGTPTSSALKTSMNALPVRAKMKQRV